MYYFLFNEPFTEPNPSFSSNDGKSVKFVGETSKLKSVALVAGGESVDKGTISPLSGNVSVVAGNSAAILAASSFYKIVKVIIKTKTCFIAEHVRNYKL